MALVKITWKETTEYVREVEVDGFNGSEDDLYEALNELDDRTTEESRVLDSTDIRVTGHEITRSGDKTPEIKAAKPAYEEDF